MEQDFQDVPVEEFKRPDYQITPYIRTPINQETNMKTKFIDCVMSLENDEKITLCDWRRSDNLFLSTNTFGVNPKYVYEIIGRNCTLKLNDVSDEDYTEWRCCANIENGANNPYCDTIELRDSSVIGDFIFSKNMVKLYWGLLCGVCIGVVLIIGLCIYLIFCKVVKIRENDQQPEEPVDLSRAENQQRPVPPSPRKLRNFKKCKNHQRRVNRHRRLTRGLTSQELSRDTRTRSLVAIGDDSFVCRADPNVYV